MSIGKFFILAILLPMATIYLTLTLKGERKEIVELEDEQDRIIELERLNSENFKMVFEKAEPSLNDQSVTQQSSNTQAKKINTLKNKSDTANTSVSKSTIFTLEKSTQSGQLITSIEAMIKFKKNKRAGNVAENNYNSIFNDEVEIKNTTKPVNATNKSRTKIKETRKINKNSSKQIAIISKPKRVNKSKPSKPKRSQIKKVKKIKIVKIKKSNKQQVQTSNKVIRTDKFENTANLKKRSLFKKQEIAKKRKLNKSTQELLSKLQENNFGDVFDDDGEPDIDITDLDTSTENSPSTKRKDPVATNDKNNKEQFTSNPCSGGSARYIARCRK